VGGSVRRCVRVRLAGRDRQALAYFSRAIDERSPNVGILEMDFLPERFKGDPRYHALVRRIGLE
jgi:hypothetical protein